MHHARVRRALATLTLAGIVAGGAGAAWAQTAWSALTPQQQVALAPLAEQWPQLNADQQLNWMAVSRHYTRMSPEEQQTLQDRMTAWAALTPNQRSQARFNFNTIKSNLSAEQRRAKWEEYRKLPPEEKERLAKKRRVPRGTAPALRPPQPGLLVKPPPAPPSQTVEPAQPSAAVYGAPRRPPRAAIPADRNTLLPKGLPEVESRAP